MKKILLVVLCFFLLGCEQEGVIEVEECVEVVKVEPGSWKALTKTYTCTYDWTDKDGIHKGAICGNVELNKNNQCKKAFVYKKDPSLECGENSYLSSKGECECNSSKYEWNRSRTFCEEKKCGENTTLKQGKDVGNTQDKWEWGCYCDEGYVLNKDRTICLNEKEHRFSLEVEAKRLQHEKRLKEGLKNEALSGIEKGIYQFVINYPQIIDPGQSNINNFIKEQVESERDGFLETMKDTTPSDSEFYMSIDYSADYLKDIVTFRFVREGPGNYSHNFSVIYDSVKKEIINLSTLEDNFPGITKYVSQKAIKAFVDQGVYKEVDLKEWLSTEDSANFENFYFKDDGSINFWLRVGPGISGSTLVTYDTQKENMFEKSDSAQNIIESYFSFMNEGKYNEAFDLLGDKKKLNAGGFDEFKNWASTIELISDIHIKASEIETDDLNIEEQVHDVTFILKYKNSSPRETSWTFFMRPREDSWEIFKSY